jgi:hypothetical protein
VTANNLISTPVIARNREQIAKQFVRVTKQSIFTKHQNLIFKKNGLLRRRVFRCREIREASRNDEINFAGVRFLNGAAKFFPRFFMSPFQGFAFLAIATQGDAFLRNACPGLRLLHAAGVLNLTMLRIDAGDRMSPLRSRRSSG